MGRWVTAAIAAMCAIGIAGCHGHSGAAASTPPSFATVPGVEFPRLAAIDPGVIDVGAQTTARPGPDRPSGVPGGLRIFLDHCELRAPGERVVSGRVVTPGNAKASAILSLSLLHGDLGRGWWVHHVTFARSGRFAIVLATAADASRPPEPVDDSADNCDATLVASSVPIASDSAFVVASATRQPFVYTAPADSIQAFGIGARLDQSQDPRTLSLYAMLSSAKSAIAKAWVPVVAGERPALLGISAAHPWCTTISVGIGTTGGADAQRVTVTTRFDCGAPGDDDQFVVATHEAVAGAPGFSWAQPAYPDDPPVARRTIGAYEVWVQGGAAVPRTTVAHIAATLTTRRNLAISAGHAPRRPGTLDAAITAFLAKHKGSTERARFPYRDGWMVVVEGPHDGVNRAGWSYTLLRAGHLASGWWTDGLGGGGGEARCYEGPTFSLGGQSGDKFAIAITGDPHWSIQGLVDGKWQTVATRNGVLFEDGTVAHPATFPGTERPLDEAGHVPACYLVDHPNAAG